MSFIIMWLAVMFPLVFSPGPANIVFAASGAKVGVKRSLPLMLGIDTVFILKSIILGFGFGQLFEQYPASLQILQFFGACYISYLAISFLKSNTNNASQPEKILGFKDGVIIQCLNAKGWIMVILMFSLFAEPAQTQFGAGGIWVLICLLAALNISMHLVWISFGQLITRLTGNQLNQYKQNIFYCLSLLIVAAWLLITNPFWQAV